MINIKPIAIHLPQFHPIPENDEWWGKGFTEWANVTKAKPRFKGHYQPHLPEQLGFYDLRLTEARLAQENLAKAYGIYGFCYYHYWFNGKLLLETPLHQKMQNPSEDLPFMLCWANENWTRTWDGRNSNVLMEQNYHQNNDDEEHIRYLISFFKDPRYIKVHGKPIFAFYRPDIIPDIEKTIQTFRKVAKEHQLELHLVWFERWHGWQENESKASLLDAAVEFQPLSKTYKKFKNVEKWSKWVYFKYLIKKYFLKKGSYPNPKLNHIIDYQKFVQFDKTLTISQNTYPGVTPGWDNSARRVDKKATVFINNHPKFFYQWLQQKLQKYTPAKHMEHFIFVNAWNEWAEGNHLEPCQKWGTAFLDQVKQIVDEYNK